eukprot:TRINITY_DN1468_c0_g1_i1.p1 TRINITY_DN1468_c0_g1~~TRINITY_DN1468_c0_g1_i1.p1  ORF type:complete len:915 (+),score=233.25 TRINITY_DN1468_c0_g1_i1:173-2917(+)
MADKKPAVLGIRREDKNRWERRAPLAPAHVKQLVERGIKVIVQPSSLRTFNDNQYRQAGAVIDDDLSEASTIIAVKEVPTELLAKDKTYMFFSHTIKAQQKNMEMLDDILARNIRLIDYETITDNSGKRLVRFGKFAGYAGMIDTLHALGDRMLALGHSTPFLHIGFSYCYSSLEAAKDAVRALGEEIGNYGLPSEMAPYTFVFTSEGNVSQGALELFRLLPHKMLTPDEMVDLVKNKKDYSPYLVYGTIISAQDYVVPIDPNETFNKADYYKNPGKYRGVFYEKYADSISIIMNCMYWDARYPRLITADQIKTLVEEKRSRLLAVGDISCDPQGSIEFLMKTTSIDQPLFVYDPITREVHDNSTDHDYIYKPGVLFIAVDNFPTEFPKEATQWFGDHLLPFMEGIVRSDISKPYEQQTDLPQEIHRAVITSNGSLTPRFKYIFDLRRENEKSLKNVLMLGAGYVARPCLEYISRDASIKVTIADISIAAAQNLIGKRKNCVAVLLDVKNVEALDALISKHAIVICLLPAYFNPQILEACIRCKKNMLNCSYISPQMKELHERAVSAGITCMNEIGLDPGIDHLEAKRVIDEVHADGGKIRSFVSWCGGLPMPESSTNPFGYKFSWSPRGVLTASKAVAKYIQDGKIVEIPGNHLFKRAQPVDIFPGFSLEGIPNRDCTVYQDMYGITDEVTTMFRGTLRYKGFSEVLEAVVDVGLLDESPKEFLQPNAPDMSWDSLMRSILEVRDDSSKRFKTKHLLKKRLRARDGFPSKGYDDDKLRRVVGALQWLGLFSEKSVSKKGTYLDCFCDLLQEKLVYEKGEDDMIILHHIFGIEWPNGTNELRTSTLVAHGDSHSMAMAKTVGLPIAIAAELVLDGLIKTPGVIGPMSPEIYRPVLKELANSGIRFVHKSTFSKK